ncbi:MAG TPA: VTT domain-containing protein [bacterium]|nr:VTT domain-containing protein [bacterium]
MAILVPNHNVWRIERAGRFATLIDAAAFFGAVRQAALQARHSILIMGWDIDSRTRLVGESGEPDDSFPAELGAFLGALVRRRPRLKVRLLLWDYSMLYATEREPFPLVALQWKTPPGVTFSFDDEVPPGASQHQKIIVIDGCLAFSGGLDLTVRRWDTPQHEFANRWRVDPAGKPYRPFHDVQGMVDGAAAHALSQLAETRWRRVTGEQTPVPHDMETHVWPAAVTPDFRDVAVGISRTCPQMGDGAEVREVERLFLDAIQAAEHSIYIENQFFTSSLVAESLAKRMQDVPHLQVLLVGPQHYDSWVEARTMRNGRIRFMRTFAEAGLQDRVKLVFPHVEEAGRSTDTMIHSKVMIIDDKLLRIGSANINNRSMGTDTECDLTIEASSPRERAAITDTRDRLLADHTGLSPSEVSRAFQSTPDLLSACAFSARGHSLRRVDDGNPDPAEMARYIESIADPERPIPIESLLSLEMSGRKALFPAARAAKLIAALVIVLSLALAWKVTPLSQYLDSKTVEATIAGFASSPWAPLYVIAAFVLGGLLEFPLILLIAGTAAALGPVLGFTCAAAGSLASAVLTYFVGAWLGRRNMESVLGPRLNRIRRRVQRGGVLAVTAIRLVPIAPFTIVNMVAGASGISFSHYIIGTALGLLPGLVMLSAMGSQIMDIIFRPSLGGVLLLAAAVATWMLVVLGAQVLVTRQRGADHDG